MVSQPSGHSDPMKRSFEAFIRPLGNSSNPGQDAEPIQSTKILGIWVGALVLWLWEETNVQYVVNLNPSTVFCCCKFVFLFEKIENKQKEAENGHFKKTQKCVHDQLAIR